MKTRLVVFTAALAAVVLPASAHSARVTVTGVVVAKQAQRGTFVIVGKQGAVRTVHGRMTGIRLGDRVGVSGSKLVDGTLRAATTRVVGHARTATVRGIVISRIANRTLVAAGRSVIVIQRRAARRSPATVELRAGSIARFGVSISGSGLRETSAAALGTTSTVEVEGEVVTVSPFVVDIEGLPVTITVPAGMALPPGLAPGDDVELTVTIDGANSFTLVSVDSSGAGDEGGGPAGQPGDQGNQQAGEDDNGQGAQAAGDDQGDSDQGDDSDSGSSDDGGGTSGGSGSGSGGDGGDGGGGDG